MAGGVISRSCRAGARRRQRRRGVRRRYGVERGRPAPASPAASSATANSAALVAPASPIAKVATGTPAGICTIEYSESCPPRCRDGTGTPSTGTVVLAASMPGRWAAPPAPAMIARRPRSSADSAKANISSGMRCADSTRTSWATPNCCEHLDGLAHRRPVAGRPHHDGDQWALVHRLSMADWRRRARPRSRRRGPGAGRRSRRPARRSRPAALRSWYSHSTGLAGTASTTQSGVRVLR